MLPLVYTQHLVLHQGYLSHIERGWPQGRDMSTLELPLANQRLISPHEPPPPSLPSEEDLNEHVGSDLELGKVWCVGLAS